MAYIPAEECIRKWAEVSRRARGLPPTNKDLAFCAQLAQILRTADKMNRSIDLIDKQES